VGRAHDTFISCGGPDLPKDTAVGRQGELRGFAFAGFYSGQGVKPLDPHIIREDISSSFFKDEQPDRHPFEGRTVPLDGEGDDKKYTWAKAPRYGGQPAETGPLADMVISGHPLFVETLEASGASVLLRQMARLIRPAMLLPAIDQWLSEMVSCKGPFYKDYTKKVTSQGYGFITAPRGFLGHWLKIENGHIVNYQVITPTAWNASPTDANGVRGPWEEAIVGTSVRDTGDPIEVEHVVRSFDPCLVCTVHVIDP
jgi:uptake hydrogenase large subunit